MELCFVFFLFNNFGKKAITISWRGGKTEASPSASHGWKEKLLYERTSEAGDKILIITSLNISAFEWGSETILSTNGNPFLPESSETHCFFPLD